MSLKVFDFANFASSSLILMFYFFQYGRNRQNQTVHYCLLRHLGLFVLLYILTMYLEFVNLSMVFMVLGLKPLLFLIFNYQ